MLDLFRRAQRVVRTGTLDHLARLIEKLWIPLTAKVFGLFLSTDLRELQSEHRVLLYPYRTPACRFQHHYLAAVLKLKGQSATVMLDPISHGQDKPVNSDALVFSSFSDLAQGILDLCEDDPILARGALDEFLRNCPVDYYFSHFNLDSEFQESVRRARNQATALMSNFSGLVVADSAYLNNRALISAALRANKPVRVFNPDGDWRPITRYEDENTLQTNFDILRSEITDESPNLVEAEKYIETRFSGRGGDFDSYGVFSDEARVPSGAQPRKVLFLHVIRDANQIPLEEFTAGYSVFTSFFEWADFCLGEIAKNPENWVIKLHPSARFYNGEAEIEARLLAKHGLGAELTEDCPTTGFILANRWPVYTHSGTIGFESAVSGYRANVCSTRYPPEIVNIAKSREDWVNLMELPLNLAAPQILNSNEIRAAKVLLHESFKPAEPLLMPSVPQPDRTSNWKFFVGLIVQELSLMGRYLNPNAIKRLEQLAHDLIISAGGQENDLKHSDTINAR